MKYGVIRLHVETQKEFLFITDLPSMQEAEELAETLRETNTDNSITYYACSYE